MPRPEYSSAPRLQAGAPDLGRGGGSGVHKTRAAPCPAKLRLPPPCLALRGLCSQGVRGPDQPGAELGCGTRARFSANWWRRGPAKAGRREQRHPDSPRFGTKEWQGLRLESAGGGRGFLQPESRGMGVSGFPGPGVLPADFSKGLQAGKAVGVKTPSAAAAAGVAAAAEQRKGGSASVQCQVLALQVRGREALTRVTVQQTDFAHKRQCQCLFLEVSTSARGQDQALLAWRIGSRPTAPGRGGSSLLACSSWGFEG